MFWQYDLGAMAHAAENSSFSVDVENTTADLIEFQRFHLTRSPMVRRQRARMNVLYSLFVVGGLLMLILDWRRGATVSDLLPLILIITAVIAVAVVIRLTYYWRLAWSLKRMLREGRNERRLQKRRISIDAEGLRTEDSGGNSATRWFAVEKVVTTPTAIYIYESALSAHILPRREFANDMAFDEFAAAAAGFHRAAHPGHCLKCGYDLSKNTSGVCPECGSAIRSNVPAVA